MVRKIRGERERRVSLEGMSSRRLVRNMRIGEEKVEEDKFIRKEERAVGGGLEERQ